MRRPASVILIASGLAIAAPLSNAVAQSTNWPAFRGANATGVTAAALPISWDLQSSKNVAWKTPIPGLAHSSPIVWGDRIYVTTAVAASGKPGVVTGDVQQVGHRFGDRHGAAHLAAARARCRQRQDRSGIAPCTRARRA